MKLLHLMSSDISQVSCENRCFCTYGPHILMKIDYLQCFNNVHFQTPSRGVIQVFSFENRQKSKVQMFENLSFLNYLTIDKNLKVGYLKISDFDVQLFIFDIRQKSICPIFENLRFLVIQVFLLTMGKKRKVRFIKAGEKV